MDRAAAAAVQSSPFRGPSKPPASHATGQDLRDRGLRPSPRGGNGTAGRSGMGHGGALAVPTTRDHGSGSLPRPGMAGVGLRLWNPGSSADGCANAPSKRRQQQQQQQQSAVQRHRIVAWGWHRPRAIRRRREDGAARAARPLRASLRTRNLKPFQVRTCGSMVSVNRSETRRCITTAAALAMRSSAGSLLVRGAKPRHKLARCS